MSELPEGMAPAQVPEPRSSASAIVLRRGAGREWEVLLGLRSRHSRFMPGHLSCPGGAADEVDRIDEPGGYLRCVRRELDEEVGLDVPAERWIEAGERTTPPMFPVRFRTRFFVTRLPDEAAPNPAPASAENESLRLAAAGVFLDEWARGSARLPPPILAILRALAGAGASSLSRVAQRVAQANAQEERVPRIEFAPDVWMLPVRTRTLPPATHTNVWLPGGRRFVIVDPGSSNPAELDRLLEVVERRRATGDEPVAVLLTHHHRDHAAGAANVCDALGLPLRAHVETLRAMGQPAAGCALEPLADGEELDLKGMTLRAIHTPGHAAGHLAYYLCEPRLLLAGDLVSGLSTILVDPGDGDMEAYLQSLSIADRIDCRLLLPGHGPPLPASRLAALIEHRLERDRRILAALRTEPTDLAELARSVYSETPQLPPHLIESQTLSHLLRLERKGQAARADAERRSWRAVRSKP